MAAGTIEVLIHPEPYTVDEVLTRHPGDPRVEILEGALIVAPWPTVRHQWVADELRVVLRDAAPSGAHAITAVNLRPDPDESTLFVPDVVVTTADLASDPVLVDAQEVLAVVEVVSPSSRSHDRLVKSHRYAAAGIPCYWRVELAGFPGYDGETFPVILVHELVEGTYQEIARLVPGRTGRTELPFPVELDPAELLR